MEGKALGIVEAWVELEREVEGHQRHGSLEEEQLIGEPIYQPEIGIRGW